MDESNKQLQIHNDLSNKNQKQPLIPSGHDSLHDNFFYKSLTLQSLGKGVQSCWTCGGV